MRKQGRKQRKQGQTLFYVLARIQVTSERKQGQTLFLDLCRFKRPFLRTTNNNILSQQLLGRFFGCELPANFANYQTASLKFFDNSSYKTGRAGASETIPNYTALFLSFCLMPTFFEAPPPGRETSLPSCFVATEVLYFAKQRRFCQWGNYL